MFTEVFKSAVAAGDEGKYEARRAVVIAKQLWPPEKGNNTSRNKNKSGEGKNKGTSHPVLTESMVQMLVEHDLYEE